MPPIGTRVTGLWNVPTIRIKRGVMRHGGVVKEQSTHMGACLVEHDGEKGHRDGRKWHKLVGDPHQVQLEMQGGADSDSKRRRTDYTNERRARSAQQKQWETECMEVKRRNQDRMEATQDLCCVDTTPETGVTPIESTLGAIWRRCCSEGKTAAEASSDEQVKQMSNLATLRQMLHKRDHNGRRRAPAMGIDMAWYEMDCIKFAMRNIQEGSHANPPLQLPGQGDGVPIKHPQCDPAHTSLTDDQVIEHYLSRRDELACDEAATCDADVSEKDIDGKVVIGMNGSFVPMKTCLQHLLAEEQHEGPPVSAMKGWNQGWGTAARSMGSKATLAIGTTGREDCMIDVDGIVNDSTKTELAALNLTSLVSGLQCSVVTQDNTAATTLAKLATDSGLSTGFLVTSVTHLPEFVDAALFARARRLLGGTPMVPQHQKAHVDKQKEDGKLTVQEWSNVRADRLCTTQQLVQGRMHTPACVQRKM